MIANIFVNREEGRLRAFWRILIQGILFLVGLSLIGFVLTAIAGGILIAVGGANLSDPQAAIAAITTHPLVQVASSLSALLAMFISYWVASRWLDRRPFRDFGFHVNSSWWMDFGFGLFLGAILMVFIFIVELSAGWVTITDYLWSFRPATGFWVAIIAYLLHYICVGIYEEMLSRGYHLRNMAEGFNFGKIGPRGALLIGYILSSSIFGFLHLGNPNASWISTVNIIVAGLFLGLGYLLTGELAIPIGIHMTWNFFQGNVFGFPVSGNAPGASFIAIQQSGAEIVTGGAFGPEAGIIGLVAMLLGALLIALWVRVRYGNTALQDRLAIYTPKAKSAQPVLENTLESTASLE